jgi:hypothetical protein
MAQIRLLKLTHLRDLNLELLLRGCSALEAANSSRKIRSSRYTALRLVVRAIT